MVRNYLYVFAGGGLGASVRYWISGLIPRWFDSGFPYANLFINVSGSFLIGLLMTSLEDRFLVSPSLRVFLTIGILGGYTTFSSFSYEAVALLNSGEIFRASIFILLSFGLCLAGTFLGA
ncbi:MAG TPA: fluoride efflux transporter CrcB, partial [Bacteroidota bacterium]|nr:fluoride efflux transporter CrcB [Bacteroidota bacterium]